MFISLFSSVCHSQQANLLLGTWKSPAIGATLVFSTNGFSYSDPSGSRNGSFQVQGNMIGMADNYGMSFYYQVQALTANMLILVDGSGRTFNYSKVNGSVNQSGKQVKSTPVSGSKASNKTSSSKNTSSSESWKVTKGSQKAVVKKDGQILTEAMVETGVNFIQFVIGQAITDGEKKGYKKAAIVEFKSTPKTYGNDCKSLQNALNKAKGLTNPAQIGAVRQAFISSFYKMTKDMSSFQKPAIVRIIDRYVPVVAFDEASGLALTQKDLNSVINYLEFCNSCYCQVMQVNQPVTESQKKWVKEQYIKSFSQLQLQQKQFMVSASLMWKLMKAGWPNLPAGQRNTVMGKMAAKFPTKEAIALQVQQQAQARQQTGTGQQGNYDGTTAASGTSAGGYNQGNYNQGGYNQGSSSGGQKKSVAQMQRELNANQNCFNMYQNSMLGNHAVMMNALEPAGSGNYWKVSDY